MRATVSAHWSDALVQMNAGEAVPWARTQPSYAMAWRRCARPDWLLRLAERCCRILADRQAIVLAACDCAETALRFVPAGEARPAEAIRVARAWCRGEAALEEVKAAASAASAASAAADAADAYATAAAARDASLGAFAGGVVQILIDMKVPGVQWLHLTEAQAYFARPS